MRGLRRISRPGHDHAARHRSRSTVTPDELRNLVRLPTDRLPAQDTIRVAHFTDTWLPRRDGIVTALRTLTDSMRDQGHQSLVVAPRHHDQVASDELLQLPSLPSGVAGFRIGAWPRGRHVLRIASWRPTILHVHTPGPVGLLGIYAARVLGLPLVQTYHTDLSAYADAYRLPPHLLAAVVSCYARKLGVHPPRGTHHWSPAAYRRSVVEAGTQLLYGAADTVIVPTDAVLRRCAVSLSFPRTRVVPTAVSKPAPRSGGRKEFRRRYGIGDDEPTVLFVGRLNREKGIDLLTAAFGRLLATVPTARLVLVGACNDSRWVDGLLARAGIAERTVRTGELPPDEVADAYAAADVFAFPSRTDTQGLVVQEAALAGLPVVLADPVLHRSGPLAGVGAFGGAEPDRFAHALAEPLVDREYARRAGAHARSRAGENSPQDYARTMANIYRACVARHVDSGHERAA